MGDMFKETIPEKKELDCPRCGFRLYYITQSGYMGKTRENYEAEINALRAFSNKVVDENIRLSNENIKLKIKLGDKDKEAKYDYPDFSSGDSSIHSITDNSDKEVKDS